VTCYSNPSTRIAGTEGVLVYVPIQADESIEVGKELNGSLTDVAFASIDAVSHSFTSASFAIKVTDKVVLDENNTWEPLATDDDCGIKVIRTINANEWNTICLPFEMNKNQLKDIFGAGVQLLKYNKYTTQNEGTDVTAVTLDFENVDLNDGFEANTPYLIKTSKAISEFEITEKLVPDDVKAGSNSKGFFLGTYKAGTIVPQNGLFLSGNKFYYSTGQTKIKAFRAYFTLNDVLSDMENVNTRVFISINCDYTEINSLQIGVDDDSWYTLNGMTLDKKPTTTGVYIHRGEKVVIKEEKRK
jgi:hypothetical protein